MIKQIVQNHENLYAKYKVKASDIEPVYKSKFELYFMKFYLKIKYALQKIKLLYLAKQFVSGISRRFPRELKLMKVRIALRGFKNKISNIVLIHPKFNEMKLVMTLLVKNEEDIIEENIIFHKSMGVDSFIVTDNNSTDKTKEILSKYKDKGWIKEIIEEKGEDISQQEWVDRMIKLAADKYKADWIINADADEFWYSKSGNLKKYIKNSNSNVIKCNIYNMLPTEVGNFI